MAVGKTVYLLNYPDGTQRALRRIEPEHAVQGTEIASGWFIDRLEFAKGGSYTDDGFPITFEAWVKRKPPDDVSDP